MTNRVCCVAMVALVLASGALAQDEDLPLKTWGAPPYWTPPVVAKESGPEATMRANAEGMTAQVQALPSSPVPFVAITPCRIVDTRVAVSDGFHQPNFADSETRTFNFPASPDCPGLPSTAGAWSLNVQYRPISVASFITLFPTGTTMPLVSTLVGNPAGFTADAAIVPAGTTGQVDVYSQYAARVVIDINGYYGPQSVVTSLNTLTGNLTLAAGSNIAITPSANTLTIAATGGPGGELPAGSTGQTLYNNGSAWVPTNALYSDGTNAFVGQSLYLPLQFPNTSYGAIFQGGFLFLHSCCTGTGSNVFLGRQAGNLTMSSSAGYNVGIGLGTLSNTTTGAANTGSGYASLLANTTGYENTATGAYSLSNNTTGNDNTASGQSSLGLNSTGAQNTAIGVVSLFLNTAGSDNTAAGFESLYSNTTANRNTAVGNAALYSQSYGNVGTPWDSLNTAVGDSALYSNQPTSTTDGIYNTAIGASGLYYNTTGAYNTGIGVASLYTNTTGSFNTASGFFSLYSNTTGADNTANGWESLASTTTGHDDTTVGFQSLLGNTTGFNNTAVGANAGNRTDTIAAYSGGTATFTPNTTGPWNTFLGEGTGATVPDLQNCTAVGVDAYCTGSNQVRIGNVYVTSIGGEVGWTALSDIRAKTDVRDLDLGLGFVMALRPVQYKLRSGNGKTDMGFVAQDIEALLGDGYNVLDIGGDPERTLSLRHTDLIAPLVKAVQEQQAEIAALKAALAASDSERARLEALVERVAKLEAAARREGTQP